MRRMADASLVRHKRVLVLAATTLKAAGVASAQPYTVTFDIVYEQAVLRPGESQLISVFTSTSIKAGTEYTIQNCAFPTLNGTKGILRGSSNALFDIVNLNNGEHGKFTDFAVPFPWNAQGINNVPGTLDGLGGVFNIQASQFQQLQIPDPPYAIPYELQEPALMWQGTWTPEPGFYGEVAFTTETSDVGQGKSPSVFVDSPAVQYWIGDRWTAVYKPDSFLVVPGPGVGTVGFAGFVVGQRRRR